MLKSTLLATTASVLIISPALAGNLAVIDVAAAAITIPATNDWSGLYAGGLVSFDSGELQYLKGTSEGPIDSLGSTTSVGGFAGYNIQRGALVFGGEIAATNGGIALEDNSDYSYGPIIDLKARVGYSFGKVLAYGVAGMSFSTYDSNGSDQYASSGFAYGAGVDVMLGANMFVGAEYLMREIEGYGASNTLSGRRGFIDSAQILVGWNF